MSGVRISYHPPSLFDDLNRRRTLEARWISLTRDVLPDQARGLGWVIAADHCFQRVFLDHACGGMWTAHITGRPAYRHASDPALQRAVALAEAVRDGQADLAALNRQSLVWRGKL